MRTKLSHFSFIIIIALALLSCQKEVDGTIDGGAAGGGSNPANKFPKVGTKWTYWYYWYNSPGGATNSKMVYHLAKSEETIGGEKWLKIVDVETDTTVYFLSAKADGLYNYANNNPNLLCKDPAAVNDTYTGFFTGAAKNFTVRGMNDTTATDLGNIALNKYEGVKDASIIDILYYNKNAWGSMAIFLSKISHPHGFCVLPQEQNVYSKN